MPKIEITNMIMIQDKDTGKVVVLERVKKWCGIAFPGGHIENDESIYDSAIREVKEETGLNVWNLKSCGFIHWYNNKTSDRYFTYFYKTTDFSGQLIDKTDEGKVFWAYISDFTTEQFAPNMENYIPMFSDNGYSEAFCTWNDDEPWEIVYR